MQRGIIGSIVTSPALAGAVLWTAVALAGSPAHAQENPQVDREEARERFGQAIDSLATRLELTEGQEAKFRLIMETSLVKRAELLEELAEIRDRGGRRRSKMSAMRGLRDEFEEQRRETREALSEVLTDEQMEMFDAIVEEQRAKMREAFERRREGHS